VMLASQSSICRLLPSLLIVRSLSGFRNEMGLTSLSRILGSRMSATAF
jgi:hypothetical protein